MGSQLNIGIATTVIDDANTVVPRGFRGTTGSRWLRRAARFAFAVILLTVWWVFLAPVAFGGGTTFTIV